MLGASLFSLLRDGWEEIRVTGEIVVDDGENTFFFTGDAFGSYPARSLLKPFQFLAAGLPAARWRRPGGPYIAALGSISATEEQVEFLRGSLKENGRDELCEYLKVPPSFPFEEGHRVRLRAEGRSPDKIFHTCFSKHLAILEACRQNGWDLESYSSADHPYHARLVETLKACLGKAWEGTPPLVTDGCGLPSPVLSAGQMARLYQRLAAEGAEGLRDLREMMMAQPGFVGGPRRLDTRLMERNAGRVVAKEGADGLLGIGVTPGEKAPRGLGILVKIAPGYQLPLLGLAVKPVLEALGLQGDAEVPKGQQVHYHFVPFERPRAEVQDVSPLVSERTAVFPGDVPYERQVSLDTRKGHHLTLSSLRGTCHLGAHADAPNHFAKAREGIDRIDPSRYVGACQVMAVTLSPGEVVKVENLPSAIRSTRVLFKTGSFPDPDRFRSDFVALSPDLLRHLATKGVRLVGIDTPSIDPADSKELKAHHASLEAGMVVLEGLDLRHVDPGLYELIAPPLRLEGADASPVRALLLPL